MMDSNFNKNNSEFQDWLLENGDSPQSDVVLKELLRQAEAEASGKDAREGEAAFASFAEQTGLKTRRKTARRLFRIATNAAAAMFLPVLATCLFLLAGKGAEDEAVWSEVVTAYSETLSVTLPDGTSVALGPCSRLIYPDRFSSSERKVFMSGDVLFDVAKNPERKFVAVADNMDVVVHGTRFHVSSFMDSDNDEVALLNGSVELRMHSDGTTVNVTPGDMVRYDRESGSIRKLRFDVNNYCRVLESGGFQFVDSPLSEIASELSRRFDVEISIEDESLAEERYYASFINGENVDEILAALNAGGRFKVNRISNKLKLTSK